MTSVEDILMENEMIMASVEDILMEEEMIRASVEDILIEEAPDYLFLIGMDGVMIKEIVVFVKKEMIMT
jgi:hypothetical protein